MFTQRFESVRSTAPFHFINNDFLTDTNAFTSDFATGVYWKKFDFTKIDCPFEIAIQYLMKFFAFGSIDYNHITRMLFTTLREVLIKVTEWTDSETHKIDYMFKSGITQLSASAICVHFDCTYISTNHSWSKTVRAIDLWKFDYLSGI